VQCELGGRLRRGPGRADPRHCKLAIGIWNVTSLKEPELVCEVKRYQLDIIGLTSTHSVGSGIKKNLDEVVPVECLCRKPSVSSPIAASSHITAAMS